MIKIIECYSNKNVIRGTLYVDIVGRATDITGLNYGTITSKQKNIRIWLSDFKDIEDTMFNIKMEYIDKDGLLFLASNIKDNPKEGKGIYGSFFLPDDGEYNFENMTKITIEGNVIFQRNEHISVNSDILEKIQLVRSKVKSSHKDFDYLKPIEAAMGSIKRSYINTAIISKEDLKWLNVIYNTFK